MSIGILSEQVIDQVDERLLRINYRFLAQEYRTERDHCEKVMALNREMRVELEAVKAELQQARERERWIPVGERLPEMEVEVEIYRSKRYGKERYTTGALTEDEGLFWYASYGSIEVECEDVLFWRPLPELPEQEAE